MKMANEPVSAFAIYKTLKKDHPPKKKVNKFKKKSAPKLVKNDAEEVLSHPLKSSPSQSRVEIKASKSSLKRRIEDKKESVPILVPIKPKSVSKKPLKKKLKAIISKGECIKEESSPSEGLQLLKWLISPMSPEIFFNKYWEQQVVHLKRGKSEYYQHILDTSTLDKILRENPLYYGRNVDVVAYDNGVKQVFNQEGRAVAAALWDYYTNGCSIRILNPHTYNHKVHLLIATLQEYFGTMVGANVYLTPPGSQGFAPHFDDIEAFIVQLEGRKHWKLYKPKDGDILARESSKNFDRSEIGEPFMELTLEAGDLLFFPRGVIHEGRTDDGAHSLHITISVYQRTAYVDLLEQILPQALRKAAAENVEFRKGLPINYLQHVGFVNSNKQSETRTQIKRTIGNLLKSIDSFIDIDSAADQLGRKFIYDSLPPVLSKNESECTSKCDGDCLKNGFVLNHVEFDLDVMVKLVRYHSIRLVMGDGNPKLYYNTENAKVYHGEDEQFLELDDSMVNSIKKLQNSYPAFISIEDLPLEDDAAKIQLIADLWEHELIVTEQPLPTSD